MWIEDMPPFVGTMVPMGLMAVAGTDPVDGTVTTGVPVGAGIPTTLNPVKAPELVGAIAPATAARGAKKSAHSISPYPTGPLDLSVVIVLFLAWVQDDANDAWHWSDKVVVHTDVTVLQLGVVVRLFRPSHVQPKWNTEGQGVHDVLLHLYDDRVGQTRQCEEDVVVAG